MAPISSNHGRHCLKLGIIVILVAPGGRRTMTCRRVTASGFPDRPPPRTVADLFVADEIAVGYSPAREGRPRANIVCNIRA